MSIGNKNNFSKGRYWPELAHKQNISGLNKVICLYLLGVFFLSREKKAQGDLITIFQYLKGGCEEDGGSVCTRSNMEKTRDNGYKSHQERFHLDRRKKFFTMSTLNQQNFVESPSLKVFKVQLDRVLENFI